MSDLSLVEYVAKLPSDSRIVNEYCNLIEEIEQLKRERETGYVKWQEKYEEVKRERDDLQAYKDLFIELANRRGYDSLAGVFNDWEARDIEQQAKGLENYVSEVMDNSFILHLDENNMHQLFLINLNATALRLRKKVKEL